MKRLLLALVALLLTAVPASAEYYEMKALEGKSGYRLAVDATPTASDFLYAPAFGFNRISFTKGSALEMTVYACENATYVAAECTSVGTLSATTNSIEVRTARPWLIFDITTKETGSNISYVSTRGHITNAGGGGLRGDCDDGDFSEFDITTGEWICATVAPGSGLAAVEDDGTPTLGGDLDADDNSITGVDEIGAKVIMDTYYCENYAGADLWAQCQAAFNDAVADGVRAVELVAPRGTYAVTSGTLDLCDDRSGQLNYGVVFRGQGSATTNGGTRVQFDAGFASAAVAATFTMGNDGVRDTITRGSGSWLDDGFKRGDLVETTGFATAANNYPRTSGTEDQTEALKVYRATALVLTVESETSVNATLTGTEAGNVRRYKAAIETCGSGAFVKNMTLISAVPTNYADILIHHRPDIAPYLACSAANVPYATYCTDAGVGATMASTGGVNGGAEGMYVYGGRHGLALTSLEATGQADHYRVKDSHFHSNRTSVYYDSLQAQPGIKLEDTQLEAFYKNGFRLASGSGILNDTTIISDETECVDDDFGPCHHVYMGYTNVNALVLSGRNFIETKAGDGIFVAPGGSEEYQRRQLSIGASQILANTSAETDLALIDADNACLNVTMEGTHFTSGTDPTNPPTITFGNSNQATCPTKISGFWSAADMGPVDVHTPVFTINNDIPISLFGVAGADGEIAAWDADGNLVGTTLAGDIAEIGNSSVGAVCASGTCFEGVGTEDNLAVTGDFKIRLDTDQGTSPGSNTFQIENGSGTDVMTVTEGGVVGAATFVATSAVTAPAVTATGAIVTGSTSSDGSVLIYQDDAGGDGILVLQAEAAPGTATYIFPTADDGATGECWKKSNDTSGTEWGACGTGGDSAFEVVDLATDLVQTVTAANDFGLGYDGAGSADTDWAFHFDVSTGALKINVPGGSIDIAADATDGGALSLKEGADDGTATWTLKAPDGGLTGTTAIVHTLSADGEIPTSAGGLGDNFASSTGVLVVTAGTVTADTTPDLGTPSALVLNASNTTGALDLGTGTIRGGVCTEYATAATIASGFAAGDMEGCWYFITSGTDTITLPAITADGQSACFYAVGANVITLDPNASDQIRRSDGTLQTAGVTITSPATAGSFGCFISANSSGTDDQWILLGSSGTWALGS